MIEPITLRSFKQMYLRWVDIMCIKKENGIEIWPPISGSHRRIRQFLNNSNLISFLEQKYKCKFIEIDLEEKNNPNLEELKKITLIKTNKHFCIFLLGLDSSLRKSLNIIKSLATFIEKYTNISIILFTEVDIVNDYLIEIMPKSIIFQNINYQPLYSYNDSMQFLKYLENKWKFNINQKLKHNLINKIGGHFLLIKEAARQIKNDPSKPLEKILNSFLIKIKGLAIFKLLNKNNMEIIIRLLKNDNNIKISDYLIKTGFVKEKKIALKYWFIIKKEIFDSFPENIENNFKFNLDLLFTPKERDVFEYMLNVNGIIKREKIADIIWGLNKEEKYSDWAIDQIMHRIRTKILKTKFPYRLKTKKGVGFILLKK